MIAAKTDFEAIGSSLIEHARDAASTRRGIVDELFPYIVQASKKMSARAISRFLEEKHGFKVSYVTIGRALRNQKRYWNLYYDPIEGHAWIVGQAHGKPLKDFMSEPEKFQEMLDGKPVYKANSRKEAIDASVEYENAVAVLDAKWFCFDESVLEEARSYLRSRFDEKPTAKNDESESE